MSRSREMLESKASQSILSYITYIPEFISPAEIIQHTALGPRTAPPLPQQS